MSVDPKELASMAELVARAVHRTAVGSDPEKWEDLTEAEQGDFLIIAHAAMGAHDAWLTANRYVIVKFKTKGEKAKERASKLLRGPGLVSRLN